MSVTDHMREWGPVRLARDAFDQTFKGSRRELGSVTARRVAAALLVLWLTARCAHLLQALIDLATSGPAYGHLVLALGLAVACAVESLLVAAVMVRARQLTLGALICDAAFGVAGLAVMSIAIGGTAASAASLNRLGSLNWMLPYTVGTATGLGLLAVSYRRHSADLGTKDTADGPGGAAADTRADDTHAWEWPSWPFAVGQAGTVAALAAAFLLSVLVPRRIPSGGLLQALADAANYAAFFAVAFVVALLLRRWVRLISQRNAKAMRRAAELSRAAYWREQGASLFGRILDFFDRLALIGDQVPEQMRAEAADLMMRIEEVGAPLPADAETGIAI